MTADCHCVALRRATRRISTIYDEALAPVGINVAQFSLLRTILQHEPVSLTELGRRTELERSTVGRNIRVLERAGLVMPALARDHRETNVALTPAGRLALQQGLPLWQVAQKAVEMMLGANGADVLHDMLTRLEAPAADLQGGHA